MNLLVAHQSGEQKGSETLVEKQACRKIFWADTTTCYRLGEREWACADKKPHKIKAEKKKEKKAGRKIAGKSCAKSLKIQHISALCVVPRGFSKKRIWTGHSQLPHESSSALWNILSSFARMLICMWPVWWNHYATFHWVFCPVTGTARELKLLAIPVNTSNKAIPVLMTICHHSPIIMSHS